MSDAKAFADWFKQELKRNDWTAADFIKRSGIPRSTVYSWSRAERKPSFEYVEAIAEAFGYQPEYIAKQAHIGTVIYEPPVDGREALVWGAVQRIDWESSDAAVEMAVNMLQTLAHQVPKRRESADEGR